MRWMNRTLLWSAVLWASAAGAQDRVSMNGSVDLRLVHATGDPSYLNGGLGALRFDPEHDGVRFGRAFLAPKWRLTDVVTVRAVIDAYGDHDRNPVDLSEFYLDVRPFPTSSIRWHARIGAFFMPVSLENRGIGWTDVYSITPSAVNTWLGEEFRTIGAEVEARWLGASSGYLGDVALVAAAYGWNDPAGALIAQRGFALTDRPSTLFGSLGKPPTRFYYEIDRKPGYYYGLSWRHHDRLEIRALRYDNHGDLGAATEAGGNAWRTRFSSLGARLEPSAYWTFIAQYLDGDTTEAADSPGEDQFHLGFHAAFALASLNWARERLTARYDDFHTHQLSGIYDLPNDDSGHSWTFAWLHECGDHWQFVAEWLRVASRFPPRLELGEPAQQVETQFQLAARYRFELAW
ncbi:MAG TPA: hypothetical protein VKP66_00825 [Steroidobacteraceae bacterium]|nr:hypothetical protein [Steroidobacteraceae bacterium]